MTKPLHVPVITIDGPSGTGKGTICHQVARHLNWHVLDSGSLYRLLALSAVKHHAALDDARTLSHLARSLDVEFCFDAALNARIHLDKTDVTRALREEQCGQNASIIAAIPEVRAALLQRQRDFAIAPGLVTDGRDMGTVVFPDADLKLFLDASQEERALRRYHQLKESEKHVSLAQVIDELGKRDARDQQRAHAPLRPAEDAIYIDTTGLTVVQVFENVLQLLKERSFC